MSFLRRGIELHGFLMSAMALAASLSTTLTVAGEEVDFDREIRPILAQKCFACHGPDSKSRQAGLRLDSFAGATAALESGVGKAIEPGKLESSVLWQRITTQNEEARMPPIDSNRMLTEVDKALLQRWIEGGATYQKHWAYRPVRRPIAPPTDSDWERNPIDQFVYRRLREQGLSPGPVANARTLIRRLSFDLTGLPASYQMTQAFAQSPMADAYERQVEELLASPQYGERMAVRWLDLVRYADTAGYHGDLPMSVSPFRDYVIKAFNDNMPFDQFTREHLAGDLLAAQNGVSSKAALRMRVASGYNRLSMMSGTMVPAEVNLAKYSAERVRNLSLVWMGATVGCAECHDHKFDPYTAEDFYSLASFFADVKEKAVYNQPGNVVRTPHAIGDWGPAIAVPTPLQAEALRELDAQIDSLKKKLSEVGKQPDKKEAIASLKLQRKKLEAKRSLVSKGVVKTNVTVAVSPREMRILPRGNSMDKSGKVVQPAIPRYFGSIKTSGRATRLDLANWLVSRDNPLTARVAMNRLWQLYFGRGLSSSLDDFGRQGVAPSHPQLLDWLACEFMDSGWDIKHMVRLIVTSATYRQSSRSTTSQRNRDPYNTLLSRQGRFRLDAEFVRDNALSVSNLIVSKMGGRSVYPYQPAGYYAHLNFPRRTYPTSKGEGLWRRSIYTHWQRQYLHPSLMAFDAPTREECAVERARSNTPLASLVLLNDPIYVEAARVFAEQILSQGPPGVHARVTFAYRRALGRDPHKAEVETLVELEKEYSDQFRQDRDAARALVAVGTRPVTKGLEPVELATWTGLSRVIFNLHEFIIRE